MIKITTKFKLAETMLNEAIEQFKQLEFIQNNPIQLHIASLYLSLIEILSASLTLLKKKQYIGVPILLRSALECYVDLINCIKNPNYIKNLEVEFGENNLKIFKSIIKYENVGDTACHKKISTFKNPSGMLQKIETKINELKSEGFCAIKNKEKFKNAEMEYEYAIDYYHLCKHSHNAFGALRERHLQTRDKQQEIIEFKPISKEYIEIYLKKISQQILYSTEKLVTFFNIKNKNVLLTLRKIDQRIK